jgi:adenylosuccinate lyase
LREVLNADTRVNQPLSTADIDAALDPNDYLGVAAELVDRALTAYRNGRTAS